MELALGLATKEVEIVVLSPTDGPLRNQYRAAGIPIAVRPELTCSTSVPAWYERDVRQLSQLLEAERGDLVFASTIDAHAAIDAANMAGIPSIWNIRESEPWRRRLADRHVTIARRALACLAYPQSLIFVATASQLAWQRFRPGGQMRVIFNAASPSLVGDDATTYHQRIRDEVGLKPSEIFLISVGTMCERKGQIDFARALNRIAPNTLAQIRVAFVGRSEGRYEERIRNELADRVVPRTTFCGEVDCASRYIGAADILVNTSRSEAFPRTFIEAAALDTAIIATRIDGTFERLLNDDSALLYAPAQIQSLCASIERLVAEPALRARLTKQARRIIVTSWTHQEMLDEYFEEISGALEEQVLP